MSVLDELLAQATAPHEEGGAPSPMGVLQLLAQIKQSRMPSGSFGGTPQGLTGDNVVIQGSGAAQKLAEMAAARAGVPVAWAHDPKFWYQTEHESGLYPNEGWAEVVKAAHADNPTSTAYGIGQFLDATRQTYNLPLHASPLNQMIAMFQYIRDRYGDPAGAYAHRMQTGWY